MAPEAPSEVSQGFPYKDSPGLLTGIFHWVHFVFGKSLKKLFQKFWVSFSENLEGSSTEDLERIIEWAPQLPDKSVKLPLIFKEFFKNQKETEQKAVKNLLVTSQGKNTDLKDRKKFQMEQLKGLEIGVENVVSVWFKCRKDK